MPQYNHTGPMNNTRVVKVRIEADPGETNAELFKDIRYMSNVTDNDKLAQLRMDLVVQAMRNLATVEGVRLVQDGAGTAATQYAGPALEVTFTTWEYGTFDNEQDITDTIGVGTYPAKTKPGLQSLLDELANVSYDGGTTGPFGTLSGSGNIVLPDGSTTAAAPTLAAGVTPSGLKVVWLG